MILTPEIVRSVRPIAENINDLSRLYPYLVEAETLKLIEVIGANLYRWLDETEFVPTIEEYTYHNVTITYQQYYELMFGGYYSDEGCSCDGAKYSAGIAAATAYHAYSRFVINNPVNTTAFGVVHKNGEFSSQVNDNILLRTSNEARKIGDAYFDHVAGHLRSLGLMECCGRVKDVPRTIMPVRRNKL